MADYYTTHTSLREGEEIIEIVRHHWITLVTPIIITTILIITPFFFMFYLLQRGPIGTSIFIALLGVAILYGARRAVVWYFNVFVITNYRIKDVDRTGLFSKTVSEAFYDDIADVSYSTHGILQTIFRAGTLRLKTKEESVSFIIEFVAEPQRLQQLLLELVKEHEPPTLIEGSVSNQEDTEALVNDFIQDTEKTKSSFIKKRL